MELWIALSGWIYAALVAALVLTALLRKPEPSAALGWSLAIVFLPVVGVLLFLVFGFNRHPRRLLRRRWHDEQFAARRDRRSACREPASGPAPETGRTRWQALADTLEALGEAPCRGGNDTRLYREGHLAFDDMADAIEAARDHVHVEFYIFRSDAIGLQLIDLLAERARAGVQVRMIVDGFGSLGVWRHLNAVRRAGGRTASFVPLLSPRRISPNLRNHRKLVVCDGHTAFFGGLNVGAEYLGRAGVLRRLGRAVRKPRARAPDERAPRDWYDLHMRLRGPSVADLQWIFAEDWSFCTGEMLEAPALFDAPAACGAVTAQVIAGGPYLEVNPIRQAFFTAFSRAERRIRVATPYLVPDLALREALESAARSGVEVTIVTQSRPPDSYLVYWCGQFYVEELLAAGVRVLEHDAGMMHAKAVAVDGEWAMLGTANLDNRSMHLNFEQMTVFDGAAGAGPIDAELGRLIAASRELTAADVARRSRGERLAVSFARLFAPLL